jgi:hypothetical protein
MAEEEDKKLSAQLKADGRGVHQISADGDCMYSAVAHQLGRVLAAPWGLPLSSATSATVFDWISAHPLRTLTPGVSAVGSDGIPSDATSLRGAAADHMLAFRDQFEPFMAISPRDGAEKLDYTAFCFQIRTTREWGRQLELRALADCLKVQIVVHSADQAPLPMKAAADVREPVLHISYHKHQ